MPSSTLPSTFAPRQHKMCEFICVCESLFLISGSVLDQPRELEVVEVSCIITLLFIEHLGHLFCCEPLSHGHKETFEFVTLDDSSLVWIKTLKGVLDDIFGVRTVQLTTEECQEG